MGHDRIPEYKPTVKLGKATVARKDVIQPEIKKENVWSKLQSTMLSRKAAELSPRTNENPTGKTTQEYLAYGFEPKSNNNSTAATAADIALSYVGKVQEPAAYENKKNTTMQASQLAYRFMDYTAKWPIQNDTDEASEAYEGVVEKVTKDIEKNLLKNQQEYLSNHEEITQGRTEEAWCADFLCHVTAKANKKAGGAEIPPWGERSPGQHKAGAWEIAEWGVQTKRLKPFKSIEELKAKAKKGDVIVLGHLKQTGHVIMVAGRNDKGQLLTVGGNQSDTVTIEPLEKYLKTSGYEVIGRINMQGAYGK